MANIKKSKPSQISSAEKNRNRYISSRYEGRSFWVRMRLHGVPIQATFDTIEDARAYRDRMLADATTDPTHRLVLQSRQKKEEIKTLTLGMMLTRYENEITVFKKAPHSEQIRIGIISRLSIATFPIELVNRDVVLHFISQIRKREISNSTVRKYLMVLSAVFTTAKRRWGISLNNPIREIEIPGNGKPRERRVEPGELDRIVEKIRSSHPIKELITLSIETTCRRSELLKLLWKDIDIENQTAVLRDTKNSETRIIPLSRSAISVLLSLKRTTSSKVFNLSKNSVTSAWGAAKKRARDQYVADCNEKNVTPQSGYITNLRWHDLRHEGTSRLFEYGLDLMEVASVTGHKTLAMLRNYTHLKAQNLAQKLDRASESNLDANYQNAS
ncbi:MAG: tyrosine-type recombinase/integrase [Aquirhabdus sp.]